MSSFTPNHPRICLFICDPTKEEFIQSYGNITALFSGLYSRLLISLSSTTSSIPKGTNPSKGFQIQPFDLVREPFPVSESENELAAFISQFDAILVSGSAHGISDKVLWIKKLGRLLNHAATRYPRVKLMGVCFGHQLISHAVFGLKGRPNPKGWEIGPYKVQLEDAGKRLFKDKEHLYLEMFHKDEMLSQGQVAALLEIARVNPYLKSEHNLNKKYEVWGRSEKTENQGIVSWEGEMRSSENIHVFTTQGHPELTQGMTSLLLDIFKEEIGDPDTLVEAVRRIDRFPATLDWYRVSLLMWALSTKQRVLLPTLAAQTDNANQLAALSPLGMMSDPEFYPGGKRSESVLVQVMPYVRESQHDFNANSGGGIMKPSEGS